MEKSKKPERGELGYLKWKKRGGLIHTAILVAVGLGIFILGLLLNKMEPTNIFSVFAVLMVLPAAKSLVGVILLAPFRPLEEETAKRLAGYAKAGDIVLHDVVFTSAERAMHLDCIYITEHQIIALSTSPKDKLDLIQAYFEKELKAREIPYVVFLTREEEALVKRMALRQEPVENSQEETPKLQQEVYEMLRTFIV